MNIKKFHILRIILASLFTVVLFRTTTMIVSLNYYVIARMFLDAAAYDISLDLDVGHSLAWAVIVWNYVIFLVITFIVWRFFGLPSRLGFMDKIKEIKDFIGGMLPMELVEDEKGEK